MGYSIFVYCRTVVCLHKLICRDTNTELIGTIISFMLYYCSEIAVHAKIGELPKKKKEQHQRW